MSILALVLLAQYSYVYKTDFTRREWGAFQEVIGPCYSADAGRVFNDAGTMLVVSNWENTVRSNHLIAQRNVSKSGFDSENTYYALDFYIDSNVVDWLTYPEDGPELSAQNTRFVSSQYQTATAGFQYAANPWGSPHWNFWHQTAPLSGNWYATTGTVPSLATWYRFETLINYTNNTYKWARYCFTDGGSCQYLGVDGGSLGVNLKWGETGTWVTAEAENIWQATCAGSELKLTVPMRYKNPFFSY